MVRGYSRYTRWNIHDIVRIPFLVFSLVMILIFDLKWSQEASLYTVGVSTSERKAYKLWPKAQAAYKNALEKGCVAVL